MPLVFAGLSGRANSLSETIASKDELRSAPLLCETGRRAPTQSRSHAPSRPTPARACWAAVYPGKLAATWRRNPTRHHRRHGTEDGEAKGECARAEGELKPGRRLRVHVRFPLKIQDRKSTRLNSSHLGIS